MLFRLTNVSTTFMELMNMVFKDFLNTFVILFIDDLFGYSDTPEQMQTWNTHDKSFLC